MKRKLLASILSLIMALGLCTTAFAGTWKSDDIGWWWQRDDGSYPANGWEWVDDNGDGIEECYYFNPEGYCLLDSLTPDGYIVDANGAWIVDGAVQHQQSSVSTTSTDTGSSSSSGTVYTGEIPTEWKNALSRADLYVNWMHLSKQRLYNQLTSEYGEGFSAEAAQYACDNIVADWNANALETAKTYSDTLHMSKQRIYDQLTSDYGEGFTASEAQYAIDNLNADYNANALATAKTYQDTLHMSPSAIRNQLTSQYGEKFTESEADYAIAHLDD